MFKYLQLRLIQINNQKGFGIMWLQLTFQKVQGWNLPIVRWLSLQFKPETQLNHIIDD